MGFLFRIKNTLEIANRGVVVVGDIAASDVRFTLKIGDEVEIRFSGRETVRAQFRGIPMTDPPNPNRLFSCLLANISWAMLPIGAEVWSVDNVP